MSESSLAVAMPNARLHSNFEQAIYNFSPLGILATTVGIFILLLGSFALTAGISGYAAFSRSAHGWTLREGVWPAFVLSLLIAVALGTQAYARSRDRTDRDALRAVMPECDAFEARMVDAEAWRRLRLATLLGLVIGALATILVLVPHGVWTAHPLIFVWFVLMNAFVGALFARGIAMSARGAEGWARSIDQGLTIDLLRIDSLNVIGRQGARNALIWFSVAAVILLFFVGNSGDALTLGILLLAAAMGIWIFVRPMERVHRRIQRAKHVELESIRHAIQDAYAQAPHDAGAAAKLQGLLA